MMCRWVQERLSAYLDDHLNGRDMATLWKHLQACSSCRAQEAQLRKLVQLLKATVPPEAPAGFWAETHRRLREQAQASSRRLPCSGIPWRSLILPAIAALLVAIVLWNVWPPGVGSGNPNDDWKLRVAEHAASSSVQPGMDLSRLVGWEASGINR
jgi:anti-sigma factor RsiW